MVIFALLFGGISAGIDYLESGKMSFGGGLILPFVFLLAIGVSFVIKAKYDSFTLYENGMLEAQPARVFGIPVTAPLKIRIDSNALLKLEEGGTPARRSYMLMLKTEGVRVPWVIARAHQSKHIEAYAKEFAVHFGLDLKWMDAGITSSPTFSS